MENPLLKQNQQALWQTCVQDISQLFLQTTSLPLLLNELFSQGISHIKEEDFIQDVLSFSWEELRLGIVNEEKNVISMWSFHKDCPTQKKEKTIDLSWWKEWNKHYSWKSIPKDQLKEEYQTFFADVINSPFESILLCPIRLDTTKPYSLFFFHQTEKSISDHEKILFQTVGDILFSMLEQDLQKKEIESISLQYTDLQKENYSEREEKQHRSELETALAEKQEEIELLQNKYQAIEDKQQAQNAEQNSLKEKVKLLSQKEQSLAEELAGMKEKTTSLLSENEALRDALQKSQSNIQKMIEQEEEVRKQFFKSIEAAQQVMVRTNEIRQTLETSTFHETQHSVSNSLVVHQENQDIAGSSFPEKRTSHPPQNEIKTHENQQDQTDSQTSFSVIKHTPQTSMHEKSASTREHTNKEEKKLDLEADLTGKTKHKEVMSYSSEEGSSSKNEPESSTKAEHTPQVSQSEQKISLEPETNQAEKHPQYKTMEISYDDVLDAQSIEESNEYIPTIDSSEILEVLPSYEDLPTTDQKDEPKQIDDQKEMNPRPHVNEINTEKISYQSPPPLPEHWTSPSQEIQLNNPVHKDPLEEQPRSSSTLFYVQSPENPMPAKLADTLEACHFHLSPFESIHDVKKKPIDSLVSGLFLAQQTKSRSDYFSFFPSNDKLKKLPFFEVVTEHQKMAHMRLSWNGYRSVFLKESFWSDWLQKTRFPCIEKKRVLYIGHPISQDFGASIYRLCCGENYDVVRCENPRNGGIFFGEEQFDLIVFAFDKNPMQWHSVFSNFSLSDMNEKPVLVLSTSTLDNELYETLQVLNYLLLTF